MSMPMIPARPTLRQILDRPDDIHTAGDRQIVKDHLTPEILKESSTPWFVEALAGFGTWIAALFIVMAFTITGWLQYTETMLIAGLCMAVAGGVMQRLTAPLHQGIYGRLMVAVSLAGQALCAFGLFDLHDRPTAALLFGVVSFGLMLLDPGRLQSFISAFLIGVMAFVYSIDSGAHALDGAALFCLASFIGFTFWPAGRLLCGPRKSAATAGAAGALIMLLVPTLFPDLLDQAPPGIWTTMGLIGTGVIALAALRSRMGASMNRAVAVSVGLLLILALLASEAPGIPASLLLIGLGWWRQRLATLGWGVAFLLIFCFGFYYSLDLKLMEKSLILGATAAALLLSRFFFLSSPSRASSPSLSITPARRGLFWAGLLVAMLVPSAWIVGKEVQLRSSSSILLELAPVDPRSLMQGDYMVLRFKLENALRGKGNDLPQRGHIVVRTDQHRVARFERFHDPDQPLTDGQYLLAYRKRADRVIFGHESFFFEEGQGDELSAARYAELRVDADGNGILIALLDRNRQVLARD